MSRTPDSHLKDRVLEVALNLLRREGDEGVTMRAVAEAAGTTTPTIYSRFPTKENLLIALALHARDAFLEQLYRRKSLGAAVEGYLDWALRHPHEYRLVHGHYWPKILSRGVGRPGLEWVQRKFTERFGGTPEQYEVVATSLWLLVHGAANLLTQHSAGENPRFVREQCVAGCNRIIEEAATLAKVQR